MTTLAATFLPGTGSAPPAVRLDVANAATLTPNYVSDFTSSADGWTGSTGTYMFWGNPSGALDVQSVADNVSTSTFSRTVTGLTVGRTYKYSMMAVKSDSTGGSMAMGVSGMTFGAFVSLPTRAAVSYSFVATATSHVIQFKVKPATSQVNGAYSVDTVKVIATTGWLGTTIRRTDANGTSVLVREGPGGQDTTGVTGSGVMVVTDYEAALTGTVSYTVTDGVGDTASATLAAQPAPGVWLTLPATANPATAVAPGFVPVDLVTAITEDAVSNGTIHEIVGRPDPIANPGPLLTRSGTFDVLCTTYAASKNVRALLAGGDVAMLRQPTHPGLDVYFTTTNVRVSPADITTTQYWTAQVEYQEVTRP